MSYLHQNKSGTYIFRRGIPDELREAIGRGREWTESLKTKDHALAKSLVMDVAARVEGVFQQARAKQANWVRSVQTSNIPPQVIRQVVDAWKERELYRRANLVSQDFQSGQSEFQAEWALFAHDPFAAPNAATADERREIFWKTDELDSRIEAHFLTAAEQLGYSIGPGSPALQIGWHMMRDAWIEVLKREDRWRSLDYSDFPTTAPKSFPQSAPHPSSSSNSVSPTITAALETWATGGGARGTKLPSPATVQEARAALRRFVELYGDLPIAELKRNHGSGFRDAIASIPARLKPDLARLPIQDILRLDLSQYPRKSATTINKSLTLLGAIMGRAEKDGHFDDMNWRNPFDVALVVNRMDEDSYQPFEAVELNKLFASPVFAGGERPIRGRDLTAKWVPLLALFQGARRAEILQLFVRDVSTDGDTALPIISFNRDSGKNIKTETSIRNVPIHPKLIELGFMEFVKARRKLVGDDASLWPGFEDRKKLRSTINKWGEWFNGYNREHVVDDPTKAFHSFRGTFKRFGHDSGVPENILDRLCGHAIAGVGARYGKKKQADGGRDTGISLRKLADEIGRVSFPKVGFDAIQ